MPAATTQADETDPNNYDIDPSAFEFEHEPCSTRDNTNNYSTTVGKIKGTDLWVSIFSSQTGPSEVSRHINGLGRLSTDGVDLDPQTIINAIEDEADRLHVDDDDEETEEALNWLCENAAALANELIEEWQFGAEEVVGDSLYEGHAGVDGTRAWAAHVDEAITFEAGEALNSISRQTGHEEAESRVEHEILVTALYAGVEELRNRWLKPHLEYEVDLKFEAEPWEFRAIELEQNSPLPRETARVAALKEEGFRNSVVAKVLDIHDSTVSRQLDRAKRMIDESEWLVENRPTFD